MIIIARLFSSLFRPMFYPTVGLFILLTMTYLSILPIGFKVSVLGIVYLFTVCMPMLGIFIYRKVMGWSLQELRQRRKRFVPYIINMGCYLCCMHMMTLLHLPRFMVAVLLVSLLIQCSCTLVNTRHKVSMHSAGSGGVIGALVAYAALFGFNPVWWLCGAILISGCVMTSRMILRQHTLWQVLGGTAIGIVCGIVGVLL